MAKQLYWSITVGGAPSSTPPPGLECVTTANSKIVFYLSDPDDPDLQIVDHDHEDTLIYTTVDGRLVAAVLVKLLDHEYNSTTNVHTLHVEYPDDLAIDESGLDECQVLQAECFTPEVQAKLVLAASMAGEVDPDWLTSLQAFLDSRVLNAGGLPTIPSS